MTTNIGQGVPIMRTTAMNYECEYADKCSDGEECFLKHHFLWAKSCPKWKAFTEEKMVAYSDSGGD